MNFFKFIPPHLSLNLEKLTHFLKPHTNRVYLVGGSVRDFLLEKKVFDVDIEVYDICPKQFDDLMKELGSKGVGKSFFVYKWQNIDIALARKESKNAPGHKGFLVEVCEDEKEASSRRDFTINSIMINLFNGKVLDFWGGEADLKAKILRYINAKSFSEDPLRVLRGVQFAARFGFFIEPETLKLMKSLSLKELSQTRITWELQKLFEGQFYAHGFIALYKLTLLETCFGIKLSWKKIAALSRELMRYNKNVPTHLRTYYWLFFFLHRANLDVKVILDRLKLPKEYYKMLVKAPFGNENMSDYDLVTVAIDRPLFQWVGVCRDGYIERAEKLGIYEKTYDGNIAVKNVILDGFCGKKIGQELRRRIIKKAKETYS